MMSSENRTLQAGREMTFEMTKRWQYSKVIIINKPIEQDY